MTSTSPPSFWIDRGKAISRLPADIFRGNLDLPFRHFSLISVKAEGNVTAVRWDPRYPDAASIATAIEKIYEANTATTLTFYKDGWFREKLANAHEAVARFHAVQSLKHLSISRQGFIKQHDYDPETLPPLIKLMMQFPKVFRDYAVEALFDEAENTFPITYAGPKSATVQIFGDDWLDTSGLDFGVQNEGWDKEVTRPLGEVLSSWKPRYDHVMAAMTRPGSEPVWVPYHRVALPRRTGRMFGTANLIAMGTVDITPIGGTQS